VLSVRPTEVMVAEENSIGRVMVRRGLLLERRVDCRSSGVVVLRGLDWQSCGNEVSRSGMPDLYSRHCRLVASIFHATKMEDYQNLFPNSLVSTAKSLTSRTSISLYVIANFKAFAIGENKA